MFTSVFRLVTRGSNNAGFRRYQTSNSSSAKCRDLVAQTVDHFLCVFSPLKDVADAPVPDFVSVALDPATRVNVTWSVLAMALVVNPVNVPVAEAMLAAAASPEAPLAKLSNAPATSAAVAPEPPAVIVMPAIERVWLAVSAQNLSPGAAAQPRDCTPRAF